MVNVLHKELYLPLVLVLRFFYSLLLICMNSLCFVATFSLLFSNLSSKIFNFFVNFAGKKDLFVFFTKLNAHLKDLGFFCLFLFFVFFTYLLIFIQYLTKEYHNEPAITKNIPKPFIRDISLPHTMSPSPVCTQAFAVPDKFAVRGLVVLICQNIAMLMRKPATPPMTIITQNCESLRTGSSAIFVNSPVKYTKGNSRIIASIVLKRRTAH